MCVLPLLKTFLWLVSVGDDGFLGHVLSSLGFHWKSSLRSFLCSRGHYAGRRQAKSMNIVERLRNLEWSPSRTEYPVCWKDVNIGSYCEKMQICKCSLCYVLWILGWRESVIVVLFSHLIRLLSNSAGHCSLRTIGAIQRVFDQPVPRLWILDEWVYVTWIYYSIETLLAVREVSIWM